MKKLIVVIMAMAACTSPSAPPQADGDPSEVSGSSSMADGGILEQPDDSLLALANGGDAEAQLRVALFYDRVGSYSTATTWYYRSAVQGHPVAQNNLGVNYKDGQGCVQDYEEAAHWFQLAAAQGNVLALSNLGWLYQTGHGVPQDYAEARRLYLAAAAQGHAAAQNNLGMMYLHGMGLPQDSDSAAYWFRLAAAQQQPVAKKNLKKLQKN